MTEELVEPTERPCPFCRTMVPTVARVCTGCRAFRRKPGRKWHSHRDALRVEIFVAVLTAMVVYTLIAGALTILFLSWATSPRSSRITSCTASNPDYPFC